MRRGMKYLMRNRKKTAILFILFTITSSVLLTTVLMQSSINNFKNSLNYTNGIEAKLEPIITSSGKNGGGGRNASKSSGISTQKVEEISDSEIVSNVRYNLEIPGKTNVELINIEEEQATDGEINDNILISATNNLKLEKDVLDGNIETDITKISSNEIIISDLLLEHNGLSIGDKMILSDKRETYQQEYVISGVFKNLAPYDSNDRYLVENNVYIGFDGAELLLGTEIDSYNSVSFFIKSIDDVGMLEDIIFNQNGIDAGKYKIVINDKLYNDIIAPLENIYSITKNVGIIVLIISIFIFLIFISLMIKQRYYEIGVLLALGESKTNIIKQFILENIIVYVVSFVVSTVVSFGMFSVILGSINELIQSEDIQNLLVTLDAKVDSMQLAIDPILMLFAFIAILLSIIIFVIVLLSKVLIKQPKEIMNLN